MRISDPAVVFLPHPRSAIPTQVIALIIPQLQEYQHNFHLKWIGFIFISVYMTEFVNKSQSRNHCVFMKVECIDLFSSRSLWKTPCIWNYKSNCAKYCSPLSKPIEKPSYKDIWLRWFSRQSHRIHFWYNFGNEKILFR